MNCRDDTIMGLAQRRYQVWTVLHNLTVGLGWHDARFGFSGGSSLIFLRVC